MDPSCCGSCLDSGVMSANTPANVANLLDLKDTESTSYLMAIAELSLKKTELEEKRSKVQRESKMLLDYTLKAIAWPTYLKRALGQLEEEVALWEGPMMQWNTNLKMMTSKERQYLQQLANYKGILLVYPFLWPVLYLHMFRHRNSKLS